MLTGKMNYSKIYSNLIAKVRSENRVKGSIYYESHHIIPKCDGGNDDPDNLVLLTAREHFIAHMLLWKNDRGNYKLLAPILFFKNNGAIKNSKMFESIRLIHGKFMREDNPSARLKEESKVSRKVKLSTYAKNRNPEHNRNISMAKKGQQPRLGAILKGSSKKQISESLKSYFKNNKVSEETKDKLRKIHKGRKHEKEVIVRLKEKASARPRKTCPNCGKGNLDPGNYVLHTRKCYE